MEKLSLLRSMKLLRRCKEVCTSKLVAKTKTCKKHDLKKHTLCGTSQSYPIQS